MFYRLLRLKAWQRKEIEQRDRNVYLFELRRLYEEYFEAKTKLDHYEAVAKGFCIENPLQLFNVLNGAEEIKVNQNSTECFTRSMEFWLGPYYRKENYLDAFLREEKERREIRKQP
jgi:hypothetical protein